MTQEMSQTQVTAGHCLLEESPLGLGPLLVVGAYCEWYSRTGPVLTRTPLEPG